MKLIRVWCEWDIGISNVDGEYYTIFENREKAITALEKYDWTLVDYNTWQEVEADGLLNISEITIE